MVPKGAGGFRKTLFDWPCEKATTATNSATAVDGSGQSAPSHLSLADTKNNLQQRELCNVWRRLLNQNIFARVPIARPLGLFITKIGRCGEESGSATNQESWPLITTTQPYPKAPSIARCVEVGQGIVIGPTIATKCERS